MPSPPDIPQAQTPTPISPSCTAPSEQFLPDVPAASLSAGASSFDGALVASTHSSKSGRSGKGWLPGDLPEQQPSIRHVAFAGSDRGDGRVEISPTIYSNGNEVVEPHPDKMPTLSRAMLQSFDDESEQGVDQPTTSRLAKIVNSDGFESLVAVFIAANCVSLGLEAEMMVERALHSKRAVEISEHVFTAVFLAELMLRIMANGLQEVVPSRGEFWGFLDAILVVVTGVYAVWISPIIGLDNDTLRIFTVLRALRLFRLLRVVQKVRIFREVWILLRGLMQSQWVLFWTVWVIFFITYIFGVFGVMLISVTIKEEYETALETDPTNPKTQELEELMEAIGSVMSLMYTLIQVLTLDSWNGLVRTLNNYVWWSFIFFYMYIAIAVVVMMNLVTAVIVDNAMQNTMKDMHAEAEKNERRRHKRLKCMQKLFERMDKDGDGELTWEEFEVAFRKPDLSAHLKTLGLNHGNCKELFDLMDKGDGQLSPQEFFEGAARLDGPAQSKDLLKAERATDSVCKLVTEYGEEMLRDLREALRCLPGAITVARDSPKACRPRRRPKSGRGFSSERNSRSQYDAIGNPNVFSSEASRPEQGLAKLVEAGLREAREQRLAGEARDRRLDVLMEEVGDLRRLLQAACGPQSAAATLEAPRAGRGGASTGRFYKHPRSVRQPGDADSSPDRWV